MSESDSHLVVFYLFFLVYCCWVNSIFGKVYILPRITSEVRIPYKNIFLFPTFHVANSSIVQALDFNFFLSRIHFNTISDKMIVYSVHYVCSVQVTIWLTTRPRNELRKHSTLALSLHLDLWDTFSWPNIVREQRDNFVYEIRLERSKKVPYLTILVKLNCTLILEETARFWDRGKESVQFYRNGVAFTILGSFW